MKTIIVNVTLRNIEQGLPNQSQHCPVALALRDLGYCFVEVRMGEISIWRPHEHPIKCSNPKVSIDFISKFDRDIEVEPFSFGLQVPE